MKKLSIILFVCLLFLGCKTFYYYDSGGCEHNTFNKSKETEIVGFKDTLGWDGYDYYFVLRGNKNQVSVARGNLYDTTNWKEIKIQLLTKFENKHKNCKCEN